MIRPGLRPLLLFDADLAANGLSAIAGLGGPEAPDVLAVRLRPMQSCKAIRARLHLAGLAARVVDASAVLDEGEALDVPVAVDPVRLARVARKTARGGIPGRGDRSQRRAHAVHHRLRGPESGGSCVDAIAIRAARARTALPRQPPRGDDGRFPAGRQSHRGRDGQPEGAPVAARSDRREQAARPSAGLHGFGRRRGRAGGVGSGRGGRARRHCARRRRLAARSSRLPRHAEPAPRAPRKPPGRRAPGLAAGHGSPLAGGPETARPSQGRHHRRRAGSAGRAQSSRTSTTPASRK